MVSVYMYVPVDIIPMCALSADSDMEHRGMISTRTVIYTFYIRRDTRFPTFFINSDIITIIVSFLVENQNAEEFYKTFSSSVLCLRH